MEQPLTFTDQAGHRVSAVLTTPPSQTDRAVLLLHGFLSNKNSTTNKILTRQFVEQGIATLRFDFFGQGESEGPFERILCTIALDQAKSALQVLASKGYRRIALIGSSFGGLIALLTSADQAHDPIDRTIVSLGLKCPVPDFEEMLRMEFGPHGIEEWKRSGTIPDVTGGSERVKLHYAFYEDCFRHRGYDAAKAITIPTLIVQGDCDEYVPIHQSRRLLESLASKEKRLDVLPGADHSFTKGEDFQTMITTLTDWTVEHLVGAGGESAGPPPATKGRAAS